MTAIELLAEMHPGRTILEDIVKTLGMSVNALAKELHVPATRLLPGMAESRMTICR
jgi:plasmid maintenance system antidote protein VapI